MNCHVSLGCLPGQLLVRMPDAWMAAGCACSLIPRLKELCMALGCKPAAAMPLLRRNPGLMMQGPYTLAHKRLLLGQRLELTESQLSRLVRMNPTLLLYSSGTLAERTAALCELLQVRRQVTGTRRACMHMLAWSAEMRTQ